MDKFKTRGSLVTPGVRLTQSAVEGLRYIGHRTRYLFLNRVAHRGYVASEHIPPEPYIIPSPEPFRATRVLRAHTALSPIDIRFPFHASTTFWDLYINFLLHPYPPYPGQPTHHSVYQPRTPFCDTAQHDPVPQRALHHARAKSALGSLPGRGHGVPPYAVCSIGHGGTHVRDVAAPPPAQVIQPAAEQRGGLRRTLPGTLRTRVLDDLVLLSSPGRFNSLLPLDPQLGCERGGHAEHREQRGSLSPVSPPDVVGPGIGMVLHGSTIPGTSHTFLDKFRFDTGPEAEILPRTQSISSMEESESLSTVSASPRLHAFVQKHHGATTLRFDEGAASVASFAFPISESRAAASV
ncbi:hypothetical protein DFH09DRAFT_1325409 [Mycena vulgaris]|nr:hypothetical protein DFH09DRAFT_1325409 [Mycena vulgaris]